MIVEHYTVDLSTMPSYRRRMREKRRAQRHRRITAACLAIIAGMMICASCVLISDSFRGHPAYAMEPNMAKLPEPTIEPFPNDLLIVVNDEPAPEVDFEFAEEIVGGARSRYNHPSAGRGISPRRKRRTGNTCHSRRRA